MPKISKDTLTISANGVRSYRDVEILYNSKLKFYIVVPDSYKLQFEGLSDKQLREFGADTYSKSTRDRMEGKYVQVVRGVSEYDVKEKARRFFSYLLSISVERKKVIVITFSNSGISYHGANYNNDHKPVCLEYALLYCDEVIVEKKHDPQYFLDGNVKTQINKYRCVVIDDTPDNREFLENAYSAIKLLVEKLSSVIDKDNPEVLLKLINSKQKLIG